MHLLALAQLALAGDAVQIPVQGALSGADGAPLTGAHQTTLRLRAGETIIATSTATVTFAGGTFSASIQADSADLATTEPLTISLDVAGLGESETAPVGWAPRSAWSLDSARLGGLTPDAWLRWDDVGTGLIEDDGALSVDASWVEDLANGVDDDTLGGLACADGDVPTWSGTTSRFVCAQPTFRNAAQVVAAVVSSTLTSLTVSGAVNAGSVSATGGVSGATVSASGALSGGSLAVTGAASTGALTAASVTTNGAVNAGSLAATGAVAGGSLTVTGAASTGALTAASVTSSGALTASSVVSSGGLKAGTVADEACVPATAGTIRWNGSVFQGCNGAAWVGFGAADGSSASSAASTCKSLKTLIPGTVSGTYWIKPPGAATAFQAYCDMTTDGGGWTLQFHFYNHANMSENAFISLFSHNRWTDESWRHVPGGSTTSGIGDGVRPLAGQGAIDIDWFTGAWTDLRMACNPNNSAATPTHFAQIDNYTGTNGNSKLLGSRANGASYSVTAAKNSFNQGTIWHDNEPNTGNSGHYLCDTHQGGSGSAQFGWCYTDFLNNSNDADYGDSIVSIAFGTSLGNDGWSAGFSGECGNMGQAYLADVGTFWLWIR
jgi:hypothetical protein